MTFQFTPTDGYRNVVSFPTKPANETAFRDSMQDLLDQVATELNAGTNSAAGIANMSRQAVMNGNFDIWQRGTSFLNVTGASQFVPDRWFTSFTADGGTYPTTLTHSRSAITSGDLPGSYFAYRVAVDGAGSAFGVNASYGVFHRVEHATRYLCGAGKKITLSFWAKSSIAGKRMGISFSQRYGTGGSPTASETIIGEIISLSTTWTKYTITITTNTLVGKTFGTNDDDYLQIGLFHMWGTTTATSQFGGGTAESFVGSGNIDIAQVQVNTGAQALPFQPKTFAQELRACMRYYFKTFPYSTTPAQNAGFSGAIVVELPNAAGSNFSYKLRFPISMRTTPTVTTYNTSALNVNWRDATNSADRSITVTDVADNSVTLRHIGAAGAANAYNAIHISADSEF